MPEPGKGQLQLGLGAIATYLDPETGKISPLPINDGRLRSLRISLSTHVRKKGRWAERWVVGRQIDDPSSRWGFTSSETGFREAKPSSCTHENSDLYREL